MAMIDQCPFSVTVAIRCITATIHLQCTRCVTKTSQRFRFEYHRCIYRYIKQHKLYHSRKSVVPTEFSYISQKEGKMILPLQR